MAEPDGTVRYAIVVAEFYSELAERLVTSATRVFEAAAADAVDVFAVPGAFELPLAAQMAAQTERYAGIACLGAVIRGETSHAGEGRSGRHRDAVRGARRRASRLQGVLTRGDPRTST